MNITIDKLFTLMIDPGLQEDIKGSVSDCTDFTITFSQPQTEGKVKAEFMDCMSFREVDIDTASLASAIVVAIRKGPVKIRSTVTGIISTFELLGLTEGQIALLRPRDPTAIKGTTSPNHSAKPRKKTGGRSKFYRQEDTSSDGYY